jgi:uncharacterized protein (DUF2236 family)
MTVNERINGERLVVLGWGRAILLQLAHPLVAAGVADHSTFRATAASRYTRLHSTIQSMLALTFGTPEERQAAIDRINGIHQRVHGTLGTGAGRFPAGTPYTATDPALLVWVDATLRDTLPMAYELFVGPLTRDQRDQYCAEGDEVMAALGIAEGTRPRSVAELERYMASMADRGDITVTDTARELAREVIAPPLGRALWPASHVTRLATIGLLPAPLRDAYGFAWTPDNDKALHAWARRARALRRRLPDRLARWATP